MNDAVRILDCLGAGYRLDLEDDAYLRGLLEVATPLLDRGLGVLAYTYDARDRTTAVIDRFVTSERFDPAWLPPFYAAVNQASVDVGAPERATGFAVWGQLTCGQASRIEGMRPFLPLLAHMGGSKDTFALNALDASGRGLWIGAPLLTTEAIPSDLVTLCTRLAAHLTAAVRLRKAARETSAVLTPDGTLQHVEPNRGVEAARDELRQATRDFELARTSEMRADIDGATRRWRPLVGSRWTLIDEFDSDGRRFVIAAENAPPTRADRRDLSEREHQVLTQAHLGHSVKEIAYELGLADATVRVLLHRAVRKLGASTRREALERFDALVTEDAKRNAK